MPTDFFKLSTYGYLGQVNLSEYLTVPEAQEVRKNKQKKEEGEIKVVGTPKRKVTYGRIPHLLPLWNVVSEAGDLLGSLSLQSGGEARFIPLGRKPRKKL